jgi:peptidoglycan/LPS O-acetylase OafA/YrhL
MASLKFANNIKILGVTFPVGMSFYDAFMGFCIFVIVFNTCRNLLKFSELITKSLTGISHISYELYLTQFRGLIIIRIFFTVLVPGEPLLLSAGRAILVYVLMIQICIVSAVLLQYLTNSLASRVRLAMDNFTSGDK